MLSCSIIEESCYRMLLQSRVTVLCYCRVVLPCCVIENPCYSIMSLSCVTVFVIEEQFVVLLISRDTVLCY